MEDKVQSLLPFKHLLKDNLIGLEKEALRSHIKGGITQSPHPKKLGSALTNKFITTDFSESLLEIVTPPLKGAKATLDFLENIEYVVNTKLPDDEILWHQSMPCVIRDETTIPLAQYGSSNIAKMKTVYRNGLGLRYGRTMQTIAGIHFNYSFSKQFIKEYQQSINNSQNTQDFINDVYMGISRNVLRYNWFLTYLFGASPIVCKSFLNNYHKHSLIEFNNTSLFEPFATSLRVGDIGYQNNKEDKLGVKANYNNLLQYVNSLEVATQTPCTNYQKIGLKKDNQYQQLNTNILQIENEYYSSIRPKQLTSELQTISKALKEKGVLYIELRMLDINPLLPLGIDEEQILFIEVFLLFCLLEKSPAICSNEQVEIDNNNNIVAHNGRQNDINLHHQQAPISLKEYGKKLLEKISIVLPLLETKHQNAFNKISERIYDTNKTPSAILLKTLKDNKVGFFDWTQQSSIQNKINSLKKNNHNNKIITQVKNECQNSIVKQKIIENNDTLSFEKYLKKYYE